VALEVQLAAIPMSLAESIAGQRLVDRSAATTIACHGTIGRIAG
jgi:hypothetical protein